MQMGPELRVSTFRREGGRAVQQEDFSVPASAPPPPPPPKRDPYQGFADDDTTKKTTSVPLKFLQREHSSSSNSRVPPAASLHAQQEHTIGTDADLTSLVGDASTPSKARPGCSLADAVLKQQVGLAGRAADQDEATRVQDSAQQGASQVVLPEAGIVAPAEGGGGGGGVAALGEHEPAEKAGLMDTLVATRDQAGVSPRGPGRAAAAPVAAAVGSGTTSANDSQVADLGAVPQQPLGSQHLLGSAVEPVLRQHMPGSVVGNRVSDHRAGLQQVAASQRMPVAAGMSAFGIPVSSAPGAPVSGAFGVPASSALGSAQGQSRREIFHRQAKLAAQMQRIGMPPLLEWGSSSVKVGKVVAPGHGGSTGSNAPFPQHKMVSKQQQQQQGHRVQRSRPMSGRLQQQKEEQEQKQEDGKRAQHSQQAQGVADSGNKASPQVPVHAWRLEWEARKQRAALNGPAVQRARKLKAQMAKERAQREDLSELAAEYEAVYQGMGRVAEEPLAALDGFSHTLLQSMHPHTPGLTRHKTTVPNNEVEGGSRACLKPVGIDMHAWQQAHERLDAYKREQALKQKQGAAQKKPATKDARLERLAMLLAAAQKEGGTLGIDVPRQEPASKQLQRAGSSVVESHRELGCGVTEGAREPGGKADSKLREVDRGQAFQTQPLGSSGFPSTHSPPGSQQQQQSDLAHGGGSKTLPGASQQSWPCRPSSSTSSSTKQLPMQSPVMQQPLKTHRSSHNTTSNAAGSGTDQPQIPQLPRPGSSLTTKQHRSHTLAQYHAQTHQQDTQQAHVHTTQAALLPQHGPATSHRHEASPPIAKKKDQKKGLSVVYYPVKKRPGKGQLRPEKHSLGQEQGQQQEALYQQHRQRHDHHHHHQQQQQQQQQHLQGKQRGQDLHHRQHHRKMPREQQHLLPQPHQQQQQQPPAPADLSSSMSFTNSNVQRATSVAQNPSQHSQPSVSDLSAVPGLCASPGHSSLSSPTAAQLGRFADASDDDAADSSESGDDWGVSSEDADERGFPKAVQGVAAAGGLSSMDHHPCPPDLEATDGLEAHDSWETESSTGSWGVERPPSPNLVRHDHEAHTSHQETPGPGPKVAPSLQDLLAQKGLMDPTYEPPQDEDIPQIHFTPAPCWLVQPIAHTPPRYHH